MTHYLQILKDSLGNNYMGIPFDREKLTPFLDQLKEILGESFEEYTNLQQARDNGHYHLTFMSVMEFNKVSKEIGFDKFTKQIQHLQRVPFDDIKLKGIGMVEKSGNKSYFIVCDSNLLDQARSDFDLEPKDFHITLGFKWKDIHGVRKNELYKKNDDFLSKLKYQYQKNGESFDFIKGFSNFDLDFFKLIEPIQINETNAIFRCGDYDYIQVSIVDDSLTITGKWQETNKLPILSNTLIERKFKQLN
jgi:hypothetical protein